ncbi:hypothetical protein [Gilliamella sp. Pra-s54]|uniref:hypothetical protein n=1 Tax=Gilliamella sp. Pra-s54 TaxID=2687314 RepID=UPI0013659927|nr:hypothetical protein [Gilliamella sp. Pra-s54]MWP29915.1 hypothetical protein [Gilliamella sp. Pra-s54]
MAALFLSYTQSSQALSASTNHTIYGNAPYLTFDNGQTRITDIDELLFITLPDGTKLTPSTNQSSATNPIILPYAVNNFSHIDLIVPPSQSSININDFVTQGNWGDDDGDGLEVNGVSASGNISVSFTDKNGNAVSRSDTLSICHAPYRIRLISSGGDLTTQYGMPNSTTFIGKMEDYYINPYENVAICSARPNLVYGGTDISVWDAPSYAGPANIWSSEKGFFVQSRSLSSYGLNFPSTGSDGLYFDLDIVGLDASQLSWTVNTSGIISATVSRRLPVSDPSHSDVDGWIRDKSKYVTRVTLHGPKADSSQINSSSPSSLTRPSLPQTFELVGRDSSGNEVKYGFVLRKWFVNRGNQKKPYSDHLAWCNSLGYREPQVKDLTNAVLIAQDASVISGATPLAPHNGYQRRIGAGFFTEWGNVGNYVDFGSSGSYYWTSESDTSSINVAKFIVNGGDGRISYLTPYWYSYTVCSTP